MSHISFVDRLEQLFKLLRTSEVIAWLPLLGVTLVTWLTVAYGLLTFNRLPADGAQHDLDLLMFAASSGTLSVALVWTLLLALTISITSPVPRKSGWLWLTALAIALVTVILLSCYSNWQYPSVDTRIENATDPITYPNNVLTVVTVLAVAVAAWHLILAPKKDYRRTVKEYRILLYSVAALLGIGVIEMWCLFNWMLLIDLDRNVLVVTFGSLFSVMLVLIFVPVALAFDRFGESPSGDAKSKEMRTHLDELFALAVPFLTSLLTLVVDTLQ